MPELQTTLNADTEQPSKQRLSLNTLQEKYKFSYFSKSEQEYHLSFTRHAIIQFINRSRVTVGKRLDFESALDEMIKLWGINRKDVSNKTKQRKLKNKNKDHFTYRVADHWRFVIDTNTMTIVTMELIGKFAKLNKIIKYQKIEQRIKRDL